MKNVALPQAIESLRESYYRNPIRWMSVGMTMLVIVLVLVLYVPQVLVQRSEVKQHFTTGFQAMMSGNFAQSAQVFERVGGSGYRLANLSDEAPLYEAAALFGLGSFAQSEEAYAEYLKKNPKSDLAAAAALGIASTWEARGEYEKALDQYRDVLVRYPGTYLSNVVNYRVARLAAQLGQSAEALAVFEQLQTEEETLWFELARGRARLLRDQIANDLG